MCTWGEDVSFLQVAGRNTCMPGTLTSLLSLSAGSMGIGDGGSRKVFGHRGGWGWRRSGLYLVRLHLPQSPYSGLRGLLVDWGLWIPGNFESFSATFLLWGGSVLEDDAIWGTHRNATRGAAGVCPEAAPISLISHGPLSLEAQLGGCKRQGCWPSGVNGR